MAVAGRRKAAVPFLFRRVARLHQGTQHQTGDDLPAFILCAGIQDVPEPSRPPDIRAGQVQPGEDGAQGTGKPLQFFGIRIGMRPVKERSALAGEEFRHAFVGPHHEGFDQPVAEQPLAFMDACNFPFRTAAFGSECRLRQVQVQPPACGSAPDEHGSQLCGIAQHAGHARRCPLEFLRGLAGRVIDGVLDLPVGEPRPGEHHGVAEP